MAGHARPAHRRQDHPRPPEPGGLRFIEQGTLFGCTKVRRHRLAPCAGKDSVAERASPSANRRMGEKGPAPARSEAMAMQGCRSREISPTRCGSGSGPTKDAPHRTGAFRCRGPDPQALRNHQKRLHDGLREVYFFLSNRGAPTSAPEQY